MAENTLIEWTDHTLNFWWGCMKVSEGCKHCYAEAFSKRVGRNIWGPAATTERWRTKGPWENVRKWDRRAGELGVRRKVFCQSMSDFFEDHPQLEEWREEALVILESLVNLDIQLLTKRPENIPQMAPAWMEKWPAHIWVGTSTEDQASADERILHLLAVPARIHFLSCEPLLGPLDLGAYEGIDWVIVGGESGGGARQMNPHWPRSIRDQCIEAGTPYFFKQWGAWKPLSEMGGSGNTMVRVGKKSACRRLDGKEWSEFPR